MLHVLRCSKKAIKTNAQLARNNCIECLETTNKQKKKNTRAQYKQENSKNERKI